ncbi:hypothetical protein RHMOL_Rhmol07G0068400 [Rhododendron molle]|uniref:Uncharacterized protein n=1 Tax=Rhododendron molle TaxID=49168 RepID=A0ACC0MYK1_RHOML|nr:hypothetical protein RHMOL_Rhmol07G0068400 [Rhododendron molle]
MEKKKKQPPPQWVLHSFLVTGGEDFSPLGIFSPEVPVVDGFGGGYSGEVAAVFGQGSGRRFWVLWFRFELDLALTGCKAC